MNARTFFHISDLIEEHPIACATCGQWMQEGQPAAAGPDVDPFGVSLIYHAQCAP